MGRIATYGVLVALAVVVTASYGSEVSQEILRKFQTNPGKTCELISPIADVIDNLDVPIGAQHKSEVVWRRETPDDFRAVLPLMQVVSVAPCNFRADQEAKLFMRAIRLIERDPIAGTEAIVSEVNDFSTQGRMVFTGKLFQRIPRWYEGESTVPLDGMITSEDRSLVIDLSKAPDYIYHGWTEPQVEAKPGKHYLVEMEVKVTGQARLQMGIDYWRSIGADDRGWNADCSKANHCEGHLSKWFGPTDEWQTLRTPDALQSLTSL